MSLGQLGQFGLNVQNTGVRDAWNATILDRLPKPSPTGGMCSFTPQILSAQVFQADGVTPVPGKGPRSEERRVGKEWRAPGGTSQQTRTKGVRDTRGQGRET